MVTARTLGLLGCLLLVPQLRGQEPDACPWGWVPFEDGCYGFFSQELSWRRAEAFCQRFGADAHLVSVHSAEELRAIAALLPSRPGEDSEEEQEVEDLEQDQDEGIWIGLHHPLGSHRWHWSDGSEVDYGSWHWHHSLSRACAALQDTTDFLTWHSEPCADRKPFVCKASA